MSLRGPKRSLRGGEEPGPKRSRGVAEDVAPKRSRVHEEAAPKRSRAHEEAGSKRSRAHEESGSKRSRVEDAGSKRRRAELEDLQWQPRPISDLKINTIYNRSAPEAPAELFRKDLISAMKLPDSEPLALDEYWVITDPWKQEWERGVQVPVNPDSLPEPTVTQIQQKSTLARNEFKLPKMKYVRLTRDAHFSASEHYLSSAVAHAEAACAYDMDACDSAWLRAFNGERARAGAQPVREEQLERVIEELEIRCYDKIQATMKSEEGLGIEYDENVICDVCRSPDSEEGNEMVFCDSCNICVHQACYGITAIPSGQWLCRPCGDGVRPMCALCPNLGGAMKCTPTGHKWAHVSCVLWIPEVSIGCAEKMEPITKISAIPPSRWSLVCVLCRERTGACIQCSVKTCKTAYHVTCAFKHGLEMRAIIEDENADDGVKLRSYCQKHSVNCKKDKSAGSGSEEDESKRKRRKDMTSEEKSLARAVRLQEIESEFDKHVSIKDISSHLLDVDQDGIQYIYNYWKLKRRAGHDRPLLPPKADESDMMTHRQEQADLDKMKMFVQLRQDLERVRNLCYMVSRREKLSRSFFRMREQTFHKQVAVLSGEPSLQSSAMMAVIEANHGPSIYDRLYSHPGAGHIDDFKLLLNQIKGLDSGDESKRDFNGLIKGAKPSENPYKRVYINGSARRSNSLYSGLSSGAESLPDRDVRHTGSSYPRAIYSTTDDDDKPPTQTVKKKLFSKDPKNNENSKVSDKKKGRPKGSTRSKLDSSSEDDHGISDKKDWLRSHPLKKMEREMGSRILSGTESDELMPMRPTKTSKLPSNIYSDSESSDNQKNEDANEDKSSNATSDSQQHPFRTKAAVKEFIPSQKNLAKCTTRQSKKSVTKAKDDTDEDVAIDKENLKTSKNKENPSDLIVPQRQAAKKASENMRSTTTNIKKDPSENSIESKLIVVLEDTKTKTKPQKVKEKRKESKEGAEIPKKDRKNTSNDVFEFEKETDKDGQDILAYVPQRQAAKKAAEHIKSGMTKIPGTETVVEEPNKKKDLPESSKKSPAKVEEKKSGSSPKSSSSSSDSSSSSSSSNSSSESCDEGKSKLSSKKNLYKTLFKSEKRKSIDLPFLDKESRHASSSGSDSESPKSSSKTSHPSSSIRRSRQKKPGSPQATEITKTPDKKLQDRQFDRVVDVATSLLALGPSAEREKPSRASHPVSRASARTRTRSTAAGARNLPQRKDAGPGKPSKEEPASAVTCHKDSKENRQSSELPSTQWETDKKVEESPDKSKSLLLDSDNLSDRSWSKGKKNNHRKSEPDVVKKKDSEEVSPQKNIPLINVAKYEKTDVSEADDKKVEKDQTPIGDKNAYRASSGSDIIKSPKTPIESEHKMPEPCEGQIPKPHQEPADIENLSVTNMTKDSPNIQVSSCQKPDTKSSSKVSNLIGLIPSYPCRSIFSPQPVKDNATELYDFGNDILAVDETVNDDGFNISQGNEELKSTPLTSFFEQDFLFKEDSKEDRGVGATLSLVEKLRMKMNSKKPGDCNQNEGFDIPHDVPQVKEADSDISQIITSEKTHEKQDTEESKLYNADSAIPEIDKGINASNTSHQSQDETSSHAPEPQPSDIQPNDDNTLKLEEQKHWEPENQFDASCNSNMEMEKQLFFNMESSKNKDLLQKQASHHSEILDKVQNQQISSSDVLQSHSSNKNFDRLTLPSSRNDDMEPIHIRTESPTKEAEPLQSEAYDGESSMQPRECTPMASPFNSMMQQSKWAESELIPARRSSSSSSASNSSSRQDLIEHCKKYDTVQEKPHPEMQEMHYPELSAYHHPYPIDPDHPYMNQFSSEASPFVGTHSFPFRRPLPSPGAALFTPVLNMPYQNTTSMLQHPGSSDEPITFPIPCSAAFTSSSHNMALTTAMVATPKPSSKSSPTHDEPELTPPNSFPMQESPFPCNEDISNNSVSQGQLMLSKHPPSNDVSPLQGKKSPTKPTRMSSRFISQQTSKSPGKSPGKSPKQADISKVGVIRRGVTRNSRGPRMRGKSRGKASQFMPNCPHMDYHNKLVGTVYDLDCDEDISNDFSIFKSPWEKRKSTDANFRKVENTYGSTEKSVYSSLSPRDHKLYREITPLTPIELAVPSETPKTPPASSAPTESTQSFTSIVQPVLPGPVDMRTYSAFEPPDTFTNHLLGAFASGTADQQLPDIDEEMEKEFHDSLIASSNKSQEVAPLAPKDPPEVVETTADQIPPQRFPDVCVPKVSLTDSRNQLKVKIKGPFLDANYATSSAAPVVPQPSVPVVEQPPGIIQGPPSAVGSVTSAMISGSSNNLRRMRKKELLRQYCTQDMNMDDGMTGNVIIQAAPPVSEATYNRTMITIPKAVTSMTSIPTREDYKAVVDANMEKKRRKAAGVREMQESEDDLQFQDRNTSGLSYSTQLALSYKRRGRNTKPSPTLSDMSSGTPLAPKLKIKIGNYMSSDQTMRATDPSYFCQFKPPKKRLANIPPKPSVEDLKRESMKFRRKIMADFEEGEKEKKKRLKSEKRKKKKEKRASEMHVVNKQSTSTTKLIIRIARKKEDASLNDSDDEVLKPPTTSDPKPIPSVSATSTATSTTATTTTTPAPEDPFEYDPTAPDPLALDSPLTSDALGKARSSKVSPIRLKLARGAGGSGYVMKDSPGTEEPPAEPAIDNPDPLSVPPLPHNKHCEVR